RRAPPRPGFRRRPPIVTLSRRRRGPAGAADPYSAGRVLRPARRALPRPAAGRPGPAEPRPAGRPQRARRGLREALARRRETWPGCDEVPTGTHTALSPSLVMIVPTGAGRGAGGRAPCRHLTPAPRSGLTGASDVDVRVFTPKRVYR